jgi:hypothetical protein
MKADLQGLITGRDRDNPCDLENKADLQGLKIGRDRDKPCDLENLEGLVIPEDLMVAGGESRPSRFNNRKG